MAKQREKKKRCSRIGGQAVLEGVMMRGTSALATAVRDPDGNITVESERFKPFRERSVLFRIPIVRGVCSFALSLVTGFKILSRTAEVYAGEDEEEPGKAEKWLSEKLHVDAVKLATGIGVVLGVALAVALFVLLPNFLTDLFYRFVPLDAIASELGRNILRNLTSGIVRIALFVGYIAITSLMKDIKRLYRYHGAEHKVISCYEHGLEMTVENAKKMSTIHDRCGTTFMVLVMVIAILFFSFFGWQTLWLRVLIRLAGIPIVAGISYEILQFMAKFDNAFVRVLKAPGLALQKLTTKEPDDEMLEVSLTAFLTVQRLEENPEEPTTKFSETRSLAPLKKDAEETLGKSAGEELLMGALGLKTRTELAECERISRDGYARVKKALQRAKTGMPIAYATGSVCFYGLELCVDERVLIPRPDTERLVEAALETLAADAEARVWEPFTGSGAVAIAIKKYCPEAEVIASDINEDALEVARKNAEGNLVRVEFLRADLGEGIEGEFDLIVANPPYIPNAVIETLDPSVKDYEPRSALDGGEDGLDFYRRIKAEAYPKLKKGGTLIVEIGIGQGDAVKEIVGGEAQEIYDYNGEGILRCLRWRR